MYARGLGSNMNGSPVVACYYNREYTDFTMAWHSHPRIEVMYVKFGKLTVDYDLNGEQHAVTLFNHDYVVIDMDVKHTITVSSETTRILNLEMEFEPNVGHNRLTMQNLIAIDHSVAEFFRNADPVVKFSDTGNMERLIALVQDTLDKHENEPGDTLLALSLWSLFVQIANDSESTTRRDKNHIKYVRIALQFIRGNYHAQISSADVAAAAGVSQNYLNNLFKQSFGHTVLEHLNRFRVEQAKSLIRRGALSFGSIAQQVGFRTKQNFNKNFLRYAGTTPKAYRKTVRLEAHVYWPPESTQTTTVFD